MSHSTLSSLAPMTPVSNSNPGSRRASISIRPDIGMAFTHYKLGKTDVEVAIADESPFEDEDAEAEKLVDMSVRILPGVRALIDSLPEGKYAVATSGAKTYCHGCLTRTK